MLLSPRSPGITAHIRPDHTPEAELESGGDRVHICRGMHQSVCSAISALAFQASSLGARDDLVSFPLMNAPLCCNKTRGCTEGNMRHLKQWGDGGGSSRRYFTWHLVHLRRCEDRRISFFMVAPSSGAGDGASAATVMTTRPYDWITDLEDDELRLTACPPCDKTF